MASRAQSGERSERDVGRQIAAAMNRRVSMLADGLALAPAERLSDREMVALGDLLQSVLAAVAEGLAREAAESAVKACYRPAAPARFLADRQLAAFLLCRLHPGEGDMPLASALTEDRDPAVAAAAQDFVEGGRSGDSLPDMAPRLRERLIWSVAAAMRADLVDGGLSAGRADAALGKAGERLLSGLAVREGMEKRAETLAAALHAAGRLDPVFIERCASDGSTLLLAAALARLCSLSIASARVLLTGEPQGAALLLRGAKIGREEAVAILNARAGAHPLYGSGTDSLVRDVDAFDALPETGARDALCFWRADANYREIIAEERGG